MRQTKTLSPASLVTIPVSLRRLLSAPAGRWSFPTLSLQSMYRRLDPYPAVSSWCIYPFLPKKQRPHVRSETFGTSVLPLQQLQQGTLFRGCSHSFMFRLPYLLDLQVAPTSTASAIGQPDRLHHAMNVWLPYTNCGIATYPNRAIDMTGLSPARLRPFRPLPKTPVVS